MVQTARPVADVSNDGPWVPSIGSDLFAMLDEESPDDDDYVESPEEPDGDNFVVQLGPLEQPGDGDQVLTVRLEWEGPDEPAMVVFALYQGGRLIARKTVSPTGSFGDYSLTLTPEQAAEIEYPDQNPVEDLELHVTATSSTRKGGALGGGDAAPPDNSGGALGGGDAAPPDNSGGALGGGDAAPPDNSGGAIGGGDATPPDNSGGALGGGEQYEP